MRADALFSQRGDLWAAIGANEDEWRRAQYGKGPSRGVQRNPGLALYESRDEGEHWERNAWEAYDAYVRQIAFSDNDHGVVRTESTTYWTANRGIAWAASKFVDAGRTWPIADIANDGTAFLTIRSFGVVLGYQDGHLFRSRNAGAVWHMLRGIAPVGFFETACFTSASNGAGLITPTGGVYATRDGGGNWYELPAFRNATSLACDSSGSIYATRGNAILRVRD